MSKKWFLYFISLQLFICINVQAQERQDQETYEINHGPYLQHVSDSSVTIIWMTNRKGTGWVELAPEDSTHFYFKERPKYYDSDNGLKNVTTLHKVRIEGLSPGTKYRYRIYSKEVVNRSPGNIVYNDVAATDVFRKDALMFKTSDPNQKQLSFLMVNDIHERNDVLEKLLKMGSVEDTDLVLFAGDMINNSRTEDQIFDGFMDTSVNIFASEIPMYYARGNHETRGAFASNFSDYFPSPTGNLYYLIRQGPICFVILDSGEDKPDTDIEYGGIDGYANFDYYRSQQAQWLKTAVQSKKFKSAPIKVAILHIPPFGGWHGETEVNEKFVPILNKAGIDIMLAGHLHRYVYKEPEAGNWEFPIIVNGNNTVLQAKADVQKLDINVINRDGKQLNFISVKSRN